MHVHRGFAIYFWDDFADRQVKVFRIRGQMGESGCRAERSAHRADTTPRLAKLSHCRRIPRLTPASLRNQPSRMSASLPNFRLLAGLLVALLLAQSCLAAPPAVSNVRAAQRAGTELVDVYYDVSASVPPLTVAVQVSANGGATFAVPAVSLTGDVGDGLQPGANRHLVWNAGADWDGQFSSQVKFNIVVSDSYVPSGMVLIPGGGFQMGTPNSADGGSVELPVHTVSVSRFYMDRYEVKKQLWDDVRAWGLTHGYTDIPAGSGKGATHPVQSISWYSMVKWCNARSEKENLVPCYYTTDAQTPAAIYKTGNVNVTNAQVKWSSIGYRLPTEAEWEKAARGGSNAQRFPWGPTITHSQANYESSTIHSYDTSPTRGYHPTYAVNGTPYTSPVGSFAPNGYGLYDMAGNVNEWCWDWYGSSYYNTSPSTDPQGPPSGSNRVLRGGSWYISAFYCRAAGRNGFASPDRPYNFDYGFRCVRR